MYSGTELESRSIDERTLILIPVFNDYAAVGKLLVELDRELAAAGITAGVLIVDDGSTVESSDRIEVGSLQAIVGVDVVELRRNLGHQRAITIGLAFAENRGKCEAVVVMDGDGEDDPRDVPRLIERYLAEGGQKIVFAERTRRSESRLFKFFYKLYKVVHVMLTGIEVKVGNFSVIPRRRLSSLVVVAEMWNHYAAVGFKSRQPYCTIPTRRGRRLDGKSSMNFVSLVVHGLSAISVYSEIVGVRLLVVAVGLILATLAGVLATISIQLVTSRAIPVWAIQTAGILLVIMLQGVLFAFLLSFVMLGNRHGSTFLPLRDHGYFISGVKNIFIKEHK